LTAAVTCCRSCMKLCKNPACLFDITVLRLIFLIENNFYSFIFKTRFKELILVWKMERNFQLMVAAAYLKTFWEGGMRNLQLLRALRPQPCCRHPTWTLPVAFQTWSRFSTAFPLSKARPEAAMFSNCPPSLCGKKA